MPDNKEGAIVASNAEVRASIADMVEELAKMAAAIGDAELAMALREAMEASMLQRQSPMALRRV